MFFSNFKALFLEYSHILPFQAKNVRIKAMSHSYLPLFYHKHVGYSWIQAHSVYVDLRLAKHRHDVWIDQ